MEGQFDLVICLKALAGSDDPAGTLEMLAKLVKPQGSIVAGLYNEAQRTPVMEARKKAVENGYTPSLRDIRRFRTECPKFLKKKHIQKLFKMPEFYSMADCRELLFNQDESLYDIAGIERMMKELQLEFLGFDLPAETLAAYKKAFPDDTECRSLSNWSAFDQAHPETFGQMYKFRCRRPS
jgi:hypothetical protein